MGNGFDIYKFDIYKNDELHDVTDFELVGDYTIRITFDDATARIIDFAPILIGPMFGPLRDLNLFNQVVLDHDSGTLTWPTGADIDPTVLHDWPQHIDAIIKRRQEQFLAVV